MQETKRAKLSASSAKSVRGEAETANNPYDDTGQRALPPLRGDASAALGSLTRAPRVYVGGGGLHLNAGQIVTLAPEQERYLVNVMRLRDGSQVRVFDGVNGEFKAVVRNVGKRRRAKRSVATEEVELRIECLTRRQPSSSGVGDDGQPGRPAVELMFAPIRKQRLKMLVEKAVEVGASRLTPVLTARTQSSAADENTLSKLGMMTAVEAAEQCERMTVPHVGATPVPLASLLEDLEARHRDAASSGAAGTPREPGVVHAREDCRESSTEDPGVAADVIFVCKERDVDSPPLLDALTDYARARRNIFGSRNGAAFLIGPEGGFDDAEIRSLAACPLVRFVSLGPTVLRAETAAVYALSCWSAFWASSRGEEGPSPGINNNAAEE